MDSRALFGLGVALCAAVSGATYFGTRVVLVELRAENTGRREMLRSLEEKLAALEKNDGALDRRLLALATARSLPRDPGGAASAPAEESSPPEPVFETTSLVTHPGAVIDDLRLLSPVERSFLERYPPGENAIIIRGDEGKLGFLSISSKRDGRRTNTVLDDANFGLVEEFSTAILDQEEAIHAALADLAASGSGRESETMEEAVRIGRQLGGYYVLPVGDRFKVFSSNEVGRDRRVAMAEAHLEGIKEDFGEFTGYVLNWVQPGLEPPRAPSGPVTREGTNP
jgi:hypothetical protein